MANEKDVLRLAEMLASRLCHDLSGPIGSLNQALELAASDVPSDNEAFALAREAAAELAKRLRWRRAAWGWGGPSLDMAGLRAVAAGLRGALEPGVLPATTIFAPPMSRALLNLLLLADETLPRGGRIALSGSSADLFIAIDGPGAAWPAGLARCLADEGAAMAAIADPGTLQMPLTVLLCRSLGLRLSMLLGAGPGVPPLRLSE
jgi:histidine phosphotransferase ChpT